MQSCCSFVHLILLFFKNTDVGKDRFSNQYTMINLQQQTLNNFSNMATWREHPNKVSLKSKRGPRLVQKTKRTLSFHSYNQTQCKDWLSSSRNQKNQISSIDGMFRYFNNDKNCCDIVNFGRKELDQVKRLKFKYEITHKTAQTLRSSYTAQDEHLRKRFQNDNMSTIRNNCGKNISILPRQNRTDIVAFTDNDLIIEDTELRSSDIFSNRKKGYSQYTKETASMLNCQNLVGSKFSLRKWRQNMKGFEKIQIQKFSSFEGKDNKFDNISTFQADKCEPGCLCLPQCFWMEKWSKLIKTQFDCKNLSIDPKIQSQIEKDIRRTRPHSVYFKEFENQSSLKDVLLQYSLVSPHIGYVQGMNFIASVVVYHSKSVAQSCAIFNLIMKQKQYQKLYEGDLSLSLKLARNFKLQLKQYQPHLHNHIMKNGIDIQIYTRNWYFSMLANFVPLESMHLVIDKFLKKGFIGINQILLSLFINLKQQILSFHNEDVAIIFTIDWLSKRSEKIDWLQIVGFSQNIPSNSYYM